MKNPFLYIKSMISKKNFFIPLLFALVLTSFHVVFAVYTYCNIDSIERNQALSDNLVNPYSPLTSVFTMWMGANSSNFFSMTLWLAFPLLSTIPIDIKKDEYVFGMRNYLKRYSVTFTLSGLLTAIPMILNFLALLLFIPAIYPDSVFDIYYGVFSNSFLGNTFYCSPFAYIAIFIALNSIFSGLIGGCSLALFYIFKSRILSTLIPSIALYFIQFHEYFFESDVDVSQFSYFYPEAFPYTEMATMLTKFSILCFIPLVLVLAYNVISKDSILRGRK